MKSPKTTSFFGKINIFKQKLQLQLLLFVLYIYNTNNKRRGGKMVMKIIKRDGTIADYNPEKIKIAISKANLEVADNEQASEQEINKIIKYIENLKKPRILVEDIQDIIEQKLMASGKYALAKKYITYRYTRELVRKANTTDQSIKELIEGESDYWNNENSNKNAKVVTTQRDYLAGITSTDITRRFLLPEDIV